MYGRWTIIDISRVSSHPAVLGFRFGNVFAVRNEGYPNAENIAGAERLTVRWGS